MRRLLWIAAVAAGLLAACAPPAPTPPAAYTSPPASAAAPATEPAGSPAPTAARPPVREDFVATDPATVELAAGRPQFVEFFAFY